MFEKFKNLRELKDLQDSLQKEKTEVENQGIKVTVNGKMEIEEIQLNPGLAREEQESILKATINEAMKKVQMVAAQRMSQMKGFGF